MDAALIENIEKHGKYAIAAHDLPAALRIFKQNKCNLIHAQELFLSNPQVYEPIVIRLMNEYRKSYIALVANDFNRNHSMKEINHV